MMRKPPWSTHIALVDGSPHTGSKPPQPAADPGYALRTRLTGKAMAPSASEGLYGREIHGRWSGPW
jgi:hypothetical protein